MSRSPTPPEPTHDLRELTIDVHLRDVRELFVVDNFDPFTSEAPTRSGVEQIKSAAQTMKLPEKMNVALYLPAETLEQETVPAIHAAPTRYCAYHDGEAQAAIAALKREAILELHVGAIALAIVLALASLLSPLATFQNPLVDTLGVLVGGAMVIALWVVVWAPIETFFVDPLPFAWERRFYQRLLHADLVLRTQSA